LPSRRPMERAHPDGGSVQRRSAREMKVRMATVLADGVEQPGGLPRGSWGEKCSRSSSRGAGSVGHDLHVPRANAAWRTCRRARKASGARPGPCGSRGSGARSVVARRRPLLHQVLSASTSLRPRGHPEEDRSSPVPTGAAPRILPSGPGRPPPAVPAQHPAQGLRAGARRGAGDVRNWWRIDFPASAASGREDPARTRRWRAPVESRPG
jgi:hypothetical protein